MYRNTKPRYLYTLLIFQITHPPYHPPIYSPTHLTTTPPIHPSNPFTNPLITHPTHHQPTHHPSTVPPNTHLSTTPPTHPSTHSPIQSSPIPLTNQLITHPTHQSHSPSQHLPHTYYSPHPPTHPPTHQSIVHHNTHHTPFLSCRACTLEGLWNLNRCCIKSGKRRGGEGFRRITKL